MANRTVSVKLMADIGQYVTGMNTAAGATARLGESAKASSAQAKGGFDIAGKGALIMGGAVVAGLGMAVSKSMEFEKSMSAVRAATQASAATLGDLRDAAMKAGADTQYSATEAAGAITEMAKAGVSAKDIMGGGLSGALSLAAAGQIDVAEAAGIASTAMTQFSLSGKDLPHVADLLAAGAGKAMGSVDDLGMALNQAGLMASASGMSIEETTGTLAAFASAGLLGSDAGTSMKTMLQKLQAPSKEAAGVLSELGINVYDANGNMLGMAEIAGQLQNHMGSLTQEQRNSALATIFGSDAVRAANVLYKEGADGIKDWTAKVNDQGYAAKQAAELNDNLSGDLERLGGSFDTLMISLGEGSQGPLRSLVQMLGGLVDGATAVIGAFGSLPGPVQAAVAAFGLFMAGGSRINDFFSGILEKMGPVKDALVNGWNSASEAMASATEEGGGFGDQVGALAETALGAAGGGLKALAAAVGPELGLAAATALVTNYLGEIAEVSARMDAAAAAGDSFRTTLAQQKGALNDASLAAAEMTVEASGLSDAFAELGISSRQAASALAGNREDFHRILSDLEDMDKQAMFTNESWNQLFGTGTRMAMDAVSGKATENADAFKEAAGAAGDYFLTVGSVDAGGWGAGMAATTEAATAETKAVQEATQAQEDWLKTVQTVMAGFVDPVNTYKTLLDEKTAADRDAAEKTAAATSSSKDSWRDYVSDVSVSLDEYATRLEEQLTAQDNWRQNIAMITQRGGLEVGQILLGMGEQGVQLAAQMANGTDAEFQRMAELLIRDARNGGAGATAELDTQLKVMAAIGAAGAGATAKGIADQLGLGVTQVAGIAAQYGVTLASGINPVLQAVGKAQIALSTARVGGFLGGILPGHAEGGYTGNGGKYEPAGIVHKGEYVLTKDQTSRLGIQQIEAFANRGYAGGGFVTAANVPKPPASASYQSLITAASDGAMKKGYDGVVEWMNANVAAPGGGGPAGAGVQRWLPLVLQALGMVGQPASLAQTVLRRMQQESGGNPTAINLWDSNAKRGTPSKGLMQTIDPTFRAYAMPGHNTNVYDPLSNILASMRYAMARYGSLSAAYNKAGGYANGGTTPAGEPFWVGERGPELMWSSREKYVSSAAKSREIAGSSAAAAAPNVVIQARVFVGDREITDIVRVEAGTAVAQHNAAIARDARSSY